MSKNLDNITEQKILKNLQVLGLKNKESQVYLSLFKLGEVGASKIVSDTELHNQYVYDALSALESRGLIQHVIKRGRKKFSAKSPNQIIRLINQQKEIAEQVSEQLAKIMVLPEQQKHEVFQGQESYIAHEFNLLEQAELGSELLVIGGSGDKFAENMADQMKKYDRLRIKKKIKIKYLGSEDQKKELTDLKKSRKYFDYKILPGLFTGLVNTNIWDQAINLNIFGQPVTSFVIYNPVAADSYKQFFKTLWKIAK